MFEGVGRRSSDAEGSFLDIGHNSLNGYERNVLFRNEGDGRFVEVGWVTGSDRVEDGRGMAVADLDGDGRLDLVLRNYRSAAGILRNRGPRGSDAHWVVLDGLPIGSRVRLEAGGRTQVRSVRAGSGFLSSGSPRVHFGLGDATRIDRIEIVEPTGRTRVRKGVPVDRILRLGLVDPEVAERDAEPDPATAAGE